MVNSMSLGLILGLGIGLGLSMIGYIFLSLQKEKLIAEKERMIQNLMKIMEEKDIRRK